MGKELRIQLLEQAAAQGLAHQEGDRQDEAENDRHGTENRRDPGPCTEKRNGVHRAMPLGRAGIAPVPPPVALDQDQPDDEGEHHAGDLRRAREAAAVEPRVVDRHGERAYAEIFTGADVVERFEQRQRHAHGQGRAGEG